MLRAATNEKDNLEADIENTPKAPNWKMEVTKNQEADLDDNAKEKNKKLQNEYNDGEPKKQEKR